MDPQPLTYQQPKLQIKDQAIKSLNASLHHRVGSQEMNVSNMGFFTPSPSPVVASYLDGYLIPFQLELDLANARMASKLKRKKTLSPGFDKYFDHQAFLNRQANQQIQSARLEALKSPIPLSSSKGFQDLKDLPKLKLMETQSKWDDGRTKQIWGNCLKLMDEYEAIKDPLLTQKKKKVKKFLSKTPRPEEPEKKKILEFWKKDEAFLKQRAQMEQEINKHREEVDMKNKIQDLLAEDVDEDDPFVNFKKSNLHHSHTHEDQHSERGMLKLIASKPRIFNLKSPLQLKEKDPFTSSAPNSFAQQQSPNESSSNFVIPEQNQSNSKPLSSAQSSRGLLLSSISPRKMSPNESSNFVIPEQSSSKPVFSAQSSRGLLFSSLSTRKVSKNPSFVSQQNSKQTLSLQSSRVEKHSQVIPFPFKNEGENPKHERVKSMSTRVKRVHISPFPNNQGTKNAALLLKEKLTQMDVKMVLLEKRCRNLSLLPNSMIGKNGLSIQEMYRGSPKRDTKAN